MGPGPGFLDPVWMLRQDPRLVFVFFWIRATLPRLRYDQLMSLGWKVMLPLATLNVLVTAILVTVSDDASEEFPYLKDDSVVAGPARARARRRRRAPTAPSARRCAA